jgi:hypothetical protein
MYYVLIPRMMWLQVEALRQQAEAAGGLQREIEEVRAAAEREREELSGQVAKYQQALAQLEAKAQDEVCSIGYSMPFACSLFCALGFSSGETLDRRLLGITCAERTALGPC